VSAVSAWLRRHLFRSYRSVFKFLTGRDVPHAAIFDHVYARQKWLKGSGPGSYAETTETYRAFLQDFIATRGVKSVLDIGCGDWQFSQLINWSGVDYLGIDVSSIALAQARSFATDRIRFVESDARTMALPRADLLIMKDLLQHWTNAEIVALIPKLAQFRYCLITNGFVDGAMPALNLDKSAGSYRPVDLAKPPFCVAGTDIHTYDFAVPVAGGGMFSEQKRVFLIENTVSGGGGA
jgi:SAM-dependent methyltransferase